MENGDSPTLDDVRSTLERGGKHVTLLYIQARQKGPLYKGWNTVSYQDTLVPEYEENLKSHPNTGVLLGAPSDGLSMFDCDTEPLLEAILHDNPWLGDTLRTRGSRGGAFWLFLGGKNCPQGVCVLKVHKDSPLAVGADKQPDKHGMVAIGELRCANNGVIRGIHQKGCVYKWLVPNPPISADYDQIVWHSDIQITWEQNRAYTFHEPQSASRTPASDDLLHRAIERLTVTFLWDHFGCGPRRNPSPSPFRDDNTQGHNSFSIYDSGRRFKDHNSAYEHHRGDSYDFYQLVTKQDAKAAFKSFVELAGLGDELKENAKPVAPQPPNPVAGNTPDQVAEKLQIYYDPERACFWMQDHRTNWIKVTEGSVTRHLTEAGFHSTKAKGETISETDRILNAIQLEMSIEYAGCLGGHDKGIFDYQGKRILVLESPRIITPKKGDWPTLQNFLESLLDAENTDQLIYFNGWLQVALESLFARSPRPGQAVVLTGKKDCGKSLLQSLITEMLGGRMAKPYLYMSGQTSFNGNLFGAEHLSIEDEHPYTDIHSRRNFGAKIKEVTAIEAQNAHKKFRDGVTLPVFWRLTISVNDEPENLMILPPIDDSLSDKLIIFKVCEGAVKDPTATVTQRNAFWRKLTSELPAYIDYILNTWMIEKDFVSQRYGVMHFQHPEVLLKLGELAPETRLLQLIDAEIFKPINNVARTLDWVGGAIDLEKVLTSSLSDVQYQARSLLNWQGACGTYLGRLKKQCSARISHTKPHRGSCIWTIKAPV
jgi:hypothetical protein